MSLWSRQGSPDIEETTEGPWNRLWLLFLIPVVVVAFAIIVAVWFFHRRRRQKFARSSALRNVTLVIQDEEKARDREERRLSRANSTMSKIARRNSSVKEAREKRFSQRVSQAIAEEEKTHLHDQSTQADSGVNEQSPILSRALSDAARNPLKRKASVKHRDREVVERVWKVAGEDMGDAPMPIAAAHPRQLDKAIEVAVGPGALPSRTSSLKRKKLGELQEETRKKDLEESVEQIQEATQGHRRKDSHALSIIGESSFSEGRGSAGMSNGVSMDSIAVLTLAPIATTFHEVTQAPAATEEEEEEEEKISTPVLSPGQDAALLSTPIRPSEATWLARSNSRISSNGSGYVSANSHLRSSGIGERNFTSDDQRSLRTAEEDGEGTVAGGVPGGHDGEQQKGARSGPSSPYPAKEEGAVSVAAPALRTTDLEGGGESATTVQSSDDPFRSPISASGDDSGKNPFASPIRSSHGHQAPVPSTASEPAGDGSTTPVVPVLVTSEATPRDGDGYSASKIATHVSHSSSHDPETRKWSDVIRLKAPVNSRRNRSASPARASTPTFGRLQGTSNLNRSSSTKSAAYRKHPILLRGGRDLQKTNSLFNVTLVAGTMISGDGGTDLRRAASSSAAHGPNDALAPGSWTYSSRAAEWRATAALPKRASSMSEAQRGADSTTNPQGTASRSGGQPGAAHNLDGSQTARNALERKPSLGVAGSRFLETFE